MRRVRRLRPPGVRRDHRARPACAPASRTGSLRHRFVRRRALPFRAPHGPRRRCVLAQGGDRQAAGQCRDRPQPLFDDRRNHPAQCAAAVLRTRRRRICRGPQRQSHQWPDAAPPAGARRRDHAVDQRQRGDPASGGAVAAQPLHRPLHRRAAPARRRLLLGGADQQEADRRARPARHPAAGDRRPRWPPDPRVGNLCARHHRCALRARRRERRGRRVRRNRRAFAQAVPAGRAAPVHLRVHLFLAAGFDHRRPSRLRRAQDHGRRARARGARSRPT